MNKTFTTILSVTLLTLTISLYAQPKREFRAAWVATVTNIDWPSSKTLSSSSQKSEAIAILDKHKLNNINAIILQIRPSCDALYPSNYEPWSEYLVGVQGGNLSIYYDPLQFWIDEAHKRGMELHAWFNPYRSVVSSGSSVHSSHISKTKPEWNITYGASPYKFLDPGIPEAKNYVVTVIMDVVRRYNIDGVHFDDYFYPYGGTTNQDSATYANYKGSFNNIGDWRRNNVNSFIAMVHDSIKILKPWVKFGVSPFGIWKSGVPAGVTGLDAYSQIYCDAMNWLTNKKVDYLTPQTYWVIGGGQDYSKLMPWWGQQTAANGRHLYTGNAAYRLSASSSNWPATEIQNQLELNRVQNRAQGIVFFSSKSITGNLKGIQDSLRNNQFKYRAIHPAMPWLDTVPPLEPVSLTASVVNNSVQLQWQKPASATDNDTAQYFVVYRAQSPDTIDINNIRQIMTITPNDTTAFTDNTTQNGVSYTYAVTSFDKVDRESETAARTSITVTGIADDIATPMVFSMEQNYPNPFNPTTTLSFTLSQSNQTSLKIYDVLGREVATVADGVHDAGTYRYQFDGSSLSSGMYLYRIVSGSFVQTKKMVLQK
ncbi:MAG: family 10 glycosylhydrolase [Bacteroidota bacterium]